MPPSEPYPDLRRLVPERVCLIKPSALGDVVNALPVLSALRVHWPRAHLAWVVNRGLRGLLDGHPELDEVIAFDRSHGFGWRPVQEGWRLLAGLRRRRFDVVIDLQGLLRSALMTAATGASVRVGRADAREGAVRFYTHLVPPPAPDAHAVECLLPLARAFGAQVDPPRFVLPVTDAERAWAQAMLFHVPRPRFVLNMGARWETKRWPPAHFAEIARRAQDRYGAGLVAIGADEDRPLVEAFRACLGDRPLLDLCARTTLPQLAALTAACDLVLSNDTGPLHVAAAAGARVVGLYTCTDPKLNGPYGPRATAIATKVWCAGSYVSRCRRLDCMAELTPDRVWPTIAPLLARPSPHLGRLTAEPSRSYFSQTD